MVLSDDDRAGAALLDAAAEDARRDVGEDAVGDGQGVLAVLVAEPAARPAELPDRVLSVIADGAVAGVADAAAELLWPLDVVVGDGRCRSRSAWRSGRHEGAWPVAAWCPAADEDHLGRRCVAVAAVGDGHAGDLLGCRWWRSRPWRSPRCRRRR